MSMEPTHFLYLIVPPRQNFVFDATPDEMAIMDTHADYVRAHAARGFVLMAGPTLDGDSLGVSVLVTADEKEARAYAEGDPAVSSGLMTYRLHPWRASIRAPAVAG